MLYMYLCPNLFPKFLSRSNLATLMNIMVNYNEQVGAFFFPWDSSSQSLEQCPYFLTTEANDVLLYVTNLWAIFFSLCRYICKNRLCHLTCLLLIGLSNKSLCGYTPGDNQNSWIFNYILSLQVTINIFHSGLRHYTEHSTVVSLPFLLDGCQTLCSPQFPTMTLYILPVILNSLFRITSLAALTILMNRQCSLIIYTGSCHLQDLKRIPHSMIKQ